ncbi:hypothetical protein GCM10023069_17180 [Shinella granuli]
MGLDRRGAVAAGSTNPSPAFDCVSEASHTNRNDDAPVLEPEDQEPEQRRQRQEA